MIARIALILIFSFGIVFSFNMKVQAITCSPLAYQLAQDTLRAKWGAPHNQMILGKIVSVYEPNCEESSHNFAWELKIDGENLFTYEKVNGLRVSLDVSEDPLCENGPNFKIGPFPSEKKIFFLETNLFSEHSSLTFVKSICGNSIWDVSLKSIIRQCFISTSCSLDWFNEQPLPKHYFETFYK